MAYELRRIPEIKTLFTDQVFDNVTTNANSERVRTKPYSHFGLFLKIAVANDPTDLVFKVQFSNDDAVTWFDLKNDFFGDLRYEDAVPTVATVYEILHGPCSGRDIRLRIVATGTTAAKTFTVSAYLELYR